MTKSKSKRAVVDDKVLDEYADDIKEINATWQQQVTSIIETGRRLIELRKKVKHGEWQKIFTARIGGRALVPGKLPFSDSTADCLMEIAKNRVLSNPQHAGSLPPHWYTLYKLCAIPEKELERLIKSGTINCETKRADVEGWTQWHQVVKAALILMKFTARHTPEELALHLITNKESGWTQPEVEQIKKLPMRELGAEMERRLWGEQLEERLKLKREVAARVHYDAVAE